MPEIAIFLPTLGGGGAERNMVNLSRGLADLGVDVSLIVANASGDFRSEISAKVELVDFQKSNTTRAFPDLVRFLDTRKPKVLLSTMNHANLVAIGATHASTTDTKVVVREANTLSKTRDAAVSLKGKLIPGLVQAFYPTADHIVAPSEGVRQDLVNNFTLSPSQVSTVPNPVVDERLFAMKTHAPEIDLFSDGVPVILGVGSFSEQKDFPNLIRAYAKVLKQKRCRLVILGRGKLEGSYLRLVTELGLDDVHFPGFAANPFAYMSRAAVFVLSSRWEGLPNVPIQALACGCPVVSTDCPSGPDEILVNGKFGILVKPESSDALAAGILESLSKKHDTEGLINRSLDFSVTAVSKKYLALFRSL